jgi:choline dehydrogenase
VVAARLSEDPGSGYDRDYPVEPEQIGNSFLRQSRARVLGGCSSHNSCIGLWLFREDLDAWVKLGAHHRSSGPVRLATIPPVDPRGVALLEAAAAVGLPTVSEPMSMPTWRARLLGSGPPHGP